LGEFVRVQQYAALSLNVHLPILESGCRFMNRRDELIAELREAVRARDDFLAITAHELRNPLTPILLSLRLLRDAEQSGDGARSASELDRLERLIEHFSARVTTLLGVAQISSNRFRANTSKFNLSDLITSIIDDYKPSIVRTGSELNADIQPGIIVNLDQLAVSEILENLLSNAMKYGNRKPIQVALTAENGWARITVEDHGVGIASEDRERIFERFERVVGGRPSSGFGIGLWLTRNLAESMGGSIKVVGEQGAGSCFTVRLPVEPPGRVNE
jgi:two-component system, OmpR family, sensor kinase